MAESQPIGELVNHDLKLELLVRELSTGTSDGSVNWTATGNGSFETSVGGFNYCLFRTQVGNLQFTFTLEIKQGGAQLQLVVDGPLPATARCSEVKNLYDVVTLEESGFLESINNALSALF